MIQPIGISMLYGTCRNSVDPRPFMDQAASLGFEFGRWFGGRIAVLDGRPQNQSAEWARDQMPVFADELLQRAMHGQVALGTDTRDGDRPAYDLAVHTDQMARHAAAVRHIWLEVMNEIGYKAYQWDYSGTELRSFVDVARAAGYGGPMSIGAMLGLDELTAPADQGGVYPPCDRPFSKMVAMVHLNRDKKPEWREVCRLREIMKIQDKYACAGSNNEMGRADHPSVTRKRVYAYLAGLLGQGMGFASVFHASQPRDCQVMTGETLEAANYFIRGARVLPRGAYRFDDGHWSSSPVKRAAFVEGEGEWVIPGPKTIWRVYTFTDDQGLKRMFVIGPDVRNEAHVELRDGWARDQKIDFVDENIVGYTLKAA